MLQAIGTFPEAEKKHCAHLAVRTLQEALNGYIVDQVQRLKSAG